MGNSQNFLWTAITKTKVFLALRKFNRKIHVTLLKKASTWCPFLKPTSFQEKALGKAYAY